MGYTVLARRYRSRDFDEVVGQEPIARTLSNAIASNRIAHAYLFCGTRGVGKTTMARLLARALNVTEELVEAEAIADAIMRGEDLDVIEIDGASNRGVQEARDLIASSGLKPARCPYRIYIIDEVHMLTRDAFNALLKTMEEPPEHVKFILCTTEPNDVLATIQSRCQRFDFRAIPDHLIAGHLAGILDQEGIDADADALARISRLGEGSMRDALSILDRLLASDPGRITLELIEEMLGLPAQSRIDQLLDAMLAGDAAEALVLGQQLLQEGITIEQAIEGLVESLRSLLIAVTCGSDSPLLALGDQQRSLASQRIEGLDAAGILHMIARCEATARHVRFTASSRALFDALLVRLSMAEHLASIPDLLQGTVGTEAKKKAGKTPSRVSPRPAPVPAAPPPPSSGPDSLDVAALTADEIWRQVLEGASSPSSQALVEGLRPVRWADGELRLALEEGEAAHNGSFKARIDSLGRLIRKVLGRSVRIELDGPHEPSKPSEPAPPIENHPEVRTAMELFDAVVVDVEPMPAVDSSEKENA